MSEPACWCGWKPDGPADSHSPWQHGARGGVKPEQATTARIPGFGWASWNNKDSMDGRFRVFDFMRGDAGLRAVVAVLCNRCGKAFNIPEGGNYPIHAECDPLWSVPQPEYDNRHEIDRGEQ